MAAATGLLSVFCFAVAVTGYLYRPLGLGLRALFAVIGGLLLYQSIPTDVAGVVLLAAVGLWLRMQSRGLAANGYTG